MNTQFFFAWITLIQVTTRARPTRNHHISFKGNSNLENDFAAHWVYDSRHRLDLAVVVLAAYQLFVFLLEIVLVQIGWSTRRSMEEYSFLVGGASVVFQVLFFTAHKLYLSGLEGKSGIFAREVAVSVWALVSLVLVPLQALFVSYKAATRASVFLMSLLSVGSVCIRCESTPSCLRRSFPKTCC